MSAKIPSHRISAFSGSFFIAREGEKIERKKEERKKRKNRKKERKEKKKKKGEIQCYFRFLRRS
jgi:hypothetical protein